MNATSLNNAAVVNTTSFQSLRPNSALALVASPMTPVSEYFVKSRCGLFQSTTPALGGGILSSRTASGRRYRATEVAKLSAWPHGTAGSATRSQTSRYGKDGRYATHSERNFALNLSTAPCRRCSPHPRQITMVLNPCSASDTRTK